MGLKLRDLVGALKDTASVSKATFLSASAHLAVVRATSHHPSSSPPSSQQLSALLSFGRGSRLSASSLVSALSSRLLSTRDPAVALKSLLSFHFLLLHGPFILRDQLPPFLLRHPSSGRNPLALASFPVGNSPSSFALAAWVRWLARLLELLLLLPPNPSPEPDPDHATALLNADLLAEIDAFVAVIVEIRRVPDSSPAIEGNKLIWEAVRLVEEDLVTAERETLVRVKEMRERIGSLGFADSVEFVCLMRRLEECRDRPSDWKWTAGDEGFWLEIMEARERIEEVVVRKENEERRVRRSERTSASARVLDWIQPGTDKPVRFGSSRWVD
ncbi:putative clathrin assembly protein At4g40080 [Typha latifolia]|uniref:putative clathrin assembly protein At4g40080 n=1 Tax=Typha latifolia TaxID=4733 RepID=UPI003C2BA382